MTARVSALLACLVLSAAPLHPAEDPAARARTALAALEAAAESLHAAEDARDRVRALTATIRAFEDGLSAMREGLRQAAIRERALSERLAGRTAETAALLGALQTMGRRDSPAMLLHPAGATGTVRAGLLLAELGPALDKRVDALRAELEEVRALRSLQQAAADRMADGLGQLQAARAELNQAMAEREDLPQRFTVDPVRAAILIASSETLAGFASGLSQIVDGDTAPMPAGIPEPRIGALPLPAQGVVLHEAGEADAAGVARPGILLATRPQALVTAPTAATIRYLGPLLDFGEVVILEPRADSLIILAGLSRTWGKPGQVITAATPVGLMGGESAQKGDLPSTGGEGSGTDLSETLYIEIREDDRPVDPATWFALGQDN